MSDRQEQRAAAFDRLRAEHERLSDAELVALASGYVARNWIDYAYLRVIGRTMQRFADTGALSWSERNMLVNVISQVDSLEDA